MVRQILAPISLQFNFVMLLPDEGRRGVCVKMIIQVSQRGHWQQVFVFKNKQQLAEFHPPNTSGLKWVKTTGILMPTVLCG